MSVPPPPPPTGGPPPFGGWQPPSQPAPGGYAGPPPPPGPLQPPARRSRRGLVLGLGLGGAVLLLLLVVGLASLASRFSDGTSLSDLRRGQCFNTRKAAVGLKANRVDCARPHTDEVAGVLTFPAGEDAAYPGEDGILELGKRECAQQEAEFLGSRTRGPTTQVFVFGPNKPAWRNGDRTVVCSLREETAVKRTGSYLGE